MGTAKANYSEA